VKRQDKKLSSLSIVAMDLVDNAKQNFDKLLVTFLIFCATGIVIHLIHHGNVDAGSVDKGWQVLFTLLGLLTGMITGHKLERHRLKDQVCSKCRRRL
jgi:hypothetical protein